VSVRQSSLSLRVEFLLKTDAGYPWDAGVFISTIILNHETGFLGRNQTNKSFGTQSKLKLANSSFEFAD